MNGYMPSTEQIRAEWVDSTTDAPTPRMHAASAFDRWLADHDREVAANALEEASAVYRSGQLTGSFTSRDGYAQAWLSVRAYKIRREATS